jgi:hypothetical protein
MRAKTKSRLLPALLPALSAISMSPALAQTPAAPPAEAQDGKRIFQPDFFASYGPQSALDMVSRIPGFSVEQGEGRRGFGENAGNVLIDGDRPSTKSDDINTVLSRIPASQVDRIELTEQASAEGDARGKGQVVNVIRKKSNKLSGTYETAVQIGKRSGVVPYGSSSATIQRGQTSYEINVNSYAEPARGFGPEVFFDAQRRLVERRDYDIKSRYTEASLGGAIKTRIGRAKINANAKIGWDKGFDNRNGIITSSIGTKTADELLRTQSPASDINYEVGGDIEFPLSKTLSTKIIGLYRADDDSTDANIVTTSVGGGATSFATRSDNASTETIGRIQNDWSGIKGHTVQFGAEVALNSLDSTFSATGAPRSNVRVKETRIEPFISDVWSIAPAWKLEGGLVFETSRLSVSGDSNAKRSFNFLKPRLIATWTASKATTFEFRADREVAQLDFDEFATSADLGAGNQIDAGNAELVPEQVTSVSALVRHKFMERGSIQLKGEYQWLKDTQDLVPITLRDAAGNITARFDGAGNIGNSTRWNGELEITLPFDWFTSGFGVKGMELKYVGHYHQSRVTDPVTGLSRRMSNRPLWHQQFNLRHDLGTSGFAWGGSIFVAAPFRSFFFDQFREQRNAAQMSAFVEYKKFSLGTLKLQLSQINGDAFRRTRTFYRDTRATGDVTRIIDRTRTLDQRVTISLSGKF